MRYFLAFSHALGIHIIAFGQYCGKRDSPILLRMNIEKAPKAVNIAALPF